MDWDAHFRRISRHPLEADFGADFGASFDQHVFDAQSKLNALGYVPTLETDGLLGPKTRASILAFQARNGLPKTGTLDTATLGKLGIGLHDVQTNSLPAYPGLKSLPAKDIQAIVNTANEIGIHPDWLATIINFETAGTFSPSKENAAGSGAVGLIQFMPKTAQGLLGTKTPEEATATLKRMSFSDQLELVKRYFAPYRGKLKSLSDAYLAVLYPAFIGKAGDSVLGTSPDIIYQQNAGFDTEHKGYVTKDDITSKITAMLDSVVQRVPTGAVFAMGTSTLLGIALAGTALILILSGPSQVR